MTHKATTSADDSLTLNLSARRFRQVLLLVALAIATVSFGARLVQPGSRGIARVVDINAERSYPNWYSTLGLAASALLLGATAWVSARTNRREHVANCFFLCAVFALLSTDEIVGLHESMNGFMQRFGTFTGYLRFAWVIPAAVGVLIFAIAQLRFLASLPARSRHQFVAAGAIYVFGAIGIEMIGSNIYDQHARESMVYLMCYTLEELLELAGIALFNAALIEHLAELLGPGSMKLRFSQD